MNTHRSIIRLATIVLGTALLVASTANAQGHQRGARTAVRAARPSISTTSRPSRSMGGSTAHRLQRSTSHGRPTASRSSGSHSSRSPYSLGDIAGALQSAARNQGSGYYDPRSGYYDPRNGYYGGHNDSDHANADAYREVGIANALVNLVGIIASTQVNQNSQMNYRTVPQSGHYERRQVLIREGYYEEYQVWVPDYQVDQTRDIVAGHYETHRRWVPPVYGYQDVWVP